MDNVCIIKDTMHPDKSRTISQFNDMFGVDSAVGTNYNRRSCRRGTTLQFNNLSGVGGIGGTNDDRHSSKR